MKKSDMLKDHETAVNHHSGNLLLHAQVLDIVPLQIILKTQLEGQILFQLKRMNSRKNESGDVTTSLEFGRMDQISEVTVQILEEIVQVLEEWTRFWKNRSAFNRFSTDITIHIQSHTSIQVKVS